MSFFAARKPAFEPPPKPRFVLSARTRTSGWLARSQSALPSVEPLSTTMTSLPGWSLTASSQDGTKRSRRSLPFQLGMTSEAAVGSGSCRTGGRRRPAMSHARSVSATASGGDRYGRQGEQEPGQRFEEAQQRGLHGYCSPPGRVSASGRDASTSTARSGRVRLRALPGASQRPSATVARCEVGQQRRDR